MSRLTEEKWELLITRLKDAKCTPVIGRRVASEVPPPGCDPAGWNFEYPINPRMVREWAEAEGYPFADAEAIDRVAQFVAVKRDPLAAKEHVQSLFAKGRAPDFTVENSAHRILAELPIPVYLSTSFDNFLSQALARKPEKDPRVRLCHWSNKFKFDPELHDPEVPGATKPPQPTVANPLVYHFLGRSDYPESLVLTEDDQFEFLLNLAREEEKLIGHWVQRALSQSTILFLGYTLQDRDFMLLFRLLGHFLRDSQKRHVAVQLAPDQLGCVDPARATAHLESYFQDFKIDIYWGDCTAFAAELWSRWKAPAPAPAGP